MSVATMTRAALDAVMLCSGRRQAERLRGLGLTGRKLNEAVVLEMLARTDYDPELDRRVKFLREAVAGMISGEGTVPGPAFWCAAAAVGWRETEADGRMAAAGEVER